MEGEIKRALRAAITFLDDCGYRYAVIGGVALAQWNVIRFTHDLDIKVLVPDLEYEKARLALRSAFPTSTREEVIKNPLIVAVKIGEVIVDFLLALPGYEELIIKRAVQRELGDFQALICSAEDLIIQKAVAGRGKDWVDIEALLIEQWGELDKAFIQDWLEQFAEALEMPELLTQYKQLLEKVSNLY